jgi:pimeloyl-ACP methyl ester carboxylesterase
MRTRIADQDCAVATGGEALRPGLPAIVFVHGAGCDATVWTLFARYFARAGFNVIAPSLPAHDGSGGAPLESVGQMAGWIHLLLDVLNVERALLVGHSLGSLVALEAAGMRPERFERLVLLGTAVPMAVGDPLLDAARRHDGAAVDMILQFGHAWRSMLGANRVAGINIVNATGRLLQRHLNGVLFADLNACRNYTHGIDAAGLWARRTTLILGAEDRMTPPSAARALVESLPDADVVLIPDCGHMLMSEQPEAVHRALVRALTA